jgi:hypothetical protein
MTTIDEARENAARARRELQDSLDAIEDKLNLPKQVAAAYRRNPIAVIGTGIGIAAAAAGLIVWAVVSRRD